MSNNDEHRDKEDIDTPKQSRKRFESRFGNLEEYKKKVKEEHTAKCTMPKGTCLQCPYPLNKIKDSDLIP